jgi:hypothetical protein
MYKIYNPITEKRKKSKSDPCWDGYKQLGTKKKDGKEVPNCIPLEEADYKGKDVKLNTPTKGDVKKYKVFVKDPETGNVKKVNFGDKNMEIKRDDPERRKSFRARHDCENKKDKTTPGYWSCKLWSNNKVSDIVK